MLRDLMAVNLAVDCVYTNSFMDSAVEAKTLFRQPYTAQPHYRPQAYAHARISATSRLARNAVGGFEWAVVFLLERNHAPGYPFAGPI
jgi:hypothetical protein